MKHSPTPPTIFQKVEITDAGSEGMAVGKINEQIIFVPFVVPGDVVDVQITRKKKNTLKERLCKSTHIQQSGLNHIVPTSVCAADAGGRT